MRNAKLIVMVAILCVGASVFADTIYNVNFYRAITSYSGPAVVGSEGDYWNFITTNLSASSTKQWTLNNASGAASSLVLDTSGALQGGYSSSTDQTNPILRDWWTAMPTAQSFVLSGLDNSKTYDIYVFSDYTVRSNKTSTTIGSETKAPTATAWSTDYILNSNYVVFEGLSPTAGAITMTFTATYASGTPINGFQIVEIPEPATMALFGMGGFAIMFYKKKK